MAMNFGSDNVSGVHDAILDAIRDANAGTAAAYGHDDWSARAERRLRDVFECDLAAYLVVTGTAANALALAACCPSHGAVVCHQEAHINTDECGAPEMFTGGAKLLGVRGAAGKLTPAAVAAMLDTMGRGEHEQRPSVLSLSQATELGTAYTAAEVTALCRAGSGAGPAGAHGRRPLRQRPGAPRRARRPPSPGRREWTSCRSARPRTAPSAWRR